MTASIIIAKIMGPAIIVIAISMLVNPSNMQKIAHEFLASPAWLFMAGLLALVPGLAIIATHYVWQGWPIIITLFGWIMVLAGIVRLVFPDMVRKLGKDMIDNQVMMYGGSIVWLTLGLFLSYQGYLA